jgi:hypothetical protein
MSYVETREDAPCGTCGTTIHLDDIGAICECGYPWCDNHYCHDCGANE